VLCCQGMTRTQLYVELIRSSLMLVVDVVGRSDELKCVAFMFLKVSLSGCCLYNKNKRCMLVSLCFISSFTIIIIRTMFSITTIIGVDRNLPLMCTKLIRGRLARMRSLPQAG